MSGRLKRAWRGRLWYDTPLAILGLLLTLLGSTFFVFVYTIGAPIVPFGGLAVAGFGLWVGLLRPLWRTPTVTPSD
jgi:hypothetical protein